MTERERILSQYTMSFIHRYYPEWKQRSDEADWKFHTTRLVTYSKGSLTIDKIGQLIYKSSAKILEGESDFNTELENLCKVFDLRESWAQLLKVGIRTGWVNIIKQMYYKILNDTTIPDTKLYFVVRKTYIPLTHFLS